MDTFDSFSCRWLWIIQGIISYNTILVFIGVLLLIQGIFNTECTGASCIPLYQKSIATASEEIRYEEIATTKYTNS